MVISRTMDNVRSYFLAVPLPDMQRWQFAEMMRELRELNINLRWESDKMPHLTLYFMGPELPESFGEKVGEFVRSFPLPTASESGQAPLEKKLKIEFDDLGFFPGGEKDIRVGYVGVKENLELKSIHDFCTKNWPNEFEKREFNPHLTVFRVRNYRPGKDDLDRINEIVSAYKFDFEADQIALCKSVKGEGQIVEEVFDL